MSSENALYMFNWDHVTDGPRKETVACLFGGRGGESWDSRLHPLQPSTGVQALVYLRSLRSLRNGCESSYVFTSRVKPNKPQVKRNQEKEKKNTIYPQSVFLNICFSCAAVWPDSFIEEQKV